MSPWARGVVAAVAAFATVAGTVAAFASTPASAPSGATSGAVPTITVSPSNVPNAESAAPIRTDRCARERGDTILVDLSEQRLWTCHKRDVVMTTAVTTGSDVHPTPTGRWRVYAMEKNRWISGEDYSHQVDRWMPFHEGYGFHDSSWQHFPYGGELRRTKGSHGCVHVPARAMRVLYKWADVGTRVHIVS